MEVFSAAPSVNREASRKSSLPAGMARPAPKVHVTILSGAVPAAVSSSGRLELAPGATTRSARVRESPSGASKRAIRKRCAGAASPRALVSAGVRSKPRSAAHGATSAGLGTIAISVTSRGAIGSASAKTKDAGSSPHIPSMESGATTRGAVASSRLSKKARELHAAMAPSSTGMRTATGPPAEVNRTCTTRVVRSKLDAIAIRSSVGEDPGPPSHPTACASRLAAKSVQAPQSAACRAALPIGEDGSRSRSGVPR